ncbi:adenylosuccinate synthase, partial [Staphylococcus aureus]
QRIGIRMADLLDKETFETKLKENVAIKNEMFEKLFDAEGFKFEDIFDVYYAAGQRLKEYTVDTAKVLDDAFMADEKVLFEGAQGVMLDIDHGTYPFVTSSNPIAGNVTVGTGVGPTFVDKVVGVCKAYTSRVGDGPFPTELFDEDGHHIREVGREYGTTTGRPRRVGWFDSVVLRHSRRASGITDLSINSIDVLTGLETVKICTAYE